VHGTAAVTRGGGGGWLPLQEDPVPPVEVQHGVAPPEAASRHPRCRQAVEKRYDYIAIFIVIVMTDTGYTVTTAYM
jgi:hypothetical protein